MGRPHEAVERPCCLIISDNWLFMRGLMQRSVPPVPLRIEAFCRDIGAAISWYNEFGPLLQCGSPPPL